MRRLFLSAAIIAISLGLQPAAIIGQQGLPVSDDIGRALGGTRPVRVIVQGSDGALRGLLSRPLRGLRRQLSGGLALDMTPAEIRALAAGGGVRISGDLPVAGHADVAVTNEVTKAEQVWAGTETSGGLLSAIRLARQQGYSGRQVTVAVIDSGIAEHTAIAGRVLTHVNFVSDEPGVTGDPFGHGTHVAGIIGGSRTAASRVTGQFSGGSAPDVSLVDVRVLGRTGTGYTSDVIAGIDWAVANRLRYGIRVINLSLGHSVTEPSATDPLCQAVARAFKAGIVVVASAGNDGRTGDGRPVLGGVTSPGNSPFALTVGAIDTADTVTAADDTVAAYSSRGPSKYDFAVKPDLVAPGSRIVSLEADGSYVGRTYPQWHIAGSGRNRYLRLSGTSMAAAVVSGGVALMLDANPNLSPLDVRVALQTSARFMPEAGLIAAGAGSVDFLNAVRHSQGGLVATTLRLVNRTLCLTWCTSFRDRGGLIDRLYDGTGIHLLLSGLLDDEWNVLNVHAVDNPFAGIAPNYVVWGNAAGWTGSYYVVWGNSMQTPEGQYVVWGNSDVGSEYVVWGNSLDVDNGR